MDISIEKECSALGGLFQKVVNDMKSSSPVWEDFLNKSAKLHNALRATLLATSAFLDAFQKIADLATNSKGATREIGSALTRLCLRHKSIEHKLKAFTTCLMDVLVSPMQDKMEDWKKSVVNLDKDHQKDYKKARMDIKKASSDTMRLQKKVKKGNKSDIQTRLDSALLEVNSKYQLLEETEKKAVRSALIEERGRFCVFISCLKPVVDEEINMLTEVTHLQEILQHLCLQASDPFTLPTASEQILVDIKSSDTQQWAYQTPPSSPSSLGSRKSSMCSISSMNSSSSGGTNMSSPTHHFRNRSASQSLPAAHLAGVGRFSSVCSQDSGFTSQDTLFMKASTPPPISLLKKTSLDDSNECGSSNSGATTPSPSYSSASSTWANWPDPPLVITRAKQESSFASERPHTISSAYERTSHNRPSLSAQLFQPPEHRVDDDMTNTVEPQKLVSDYAVPYVLPKREHSACLDSGDYMRPPIPGPKPKGKPVVPPTVPVYGTSNNAENSSTIPGLKLYPAYVNQDDLAQMAAEMVKSQGGSCHEDIPEEDEEDEVTTPTPKNTQRSLSMPADTDSELTAAIKELELSTAALEMSSSTPAPFIHKDISARSLSTSSAPCDDNITSDLEDTLTSIDVEISQLEVSKESEQLTLSNSHKQVIQQRSQSFRLSKTATNSITVPNGPIIVKPGVSGATGSIRRSASTLGHSNKKPPPPVRRNSSITTSNTSGNVGCAKDKPKGSQSVVLTGNEMRRPASLNTVDNSQEFNEALVYTQPRTFTLDKQVQKSKTMSVTNNNMVTHDEDDIDLPPPPPPEMLAMDLAKASGHSNDIANTRTVLEKAQIYAKGGLIPTQEAQNNRASNSKSSKRQGSIVNTHKEVIQALNQQLSNVQSPHSPPIPASCASAQSKTASYQVEASADFDITPTPQSPGNSLLAQIESSENMLKSSGEHLASKFS